MTASEQIIEVLNYICEQVGLAIDWSVVFASENVIPYIEKLCGKFITYEIATSVVWIVVGIILILVATWLIKKGMFFYKKYNEEDSWRDGDKAAFMLALGIVLIIVCAILILIQTFDIITCIAFPEKILIEEIMEIYNSTGN